MPLCIAQSYRERHLQRPSREARRCIQRVPQAKYTGIYRGPLYIHRLAYTSLQYIHRLAYTFDRALREPLHMPHFT
jgi:hypothetical protein